MCVAQQEAQLRIRRQFLKQGRAWTLSTTLAAVRSAVRGIQTAATVVIRCSFQPSIQPCQPDVVQ